MMDLQAITIRDCLRKRMDNGPILTAVLFYRDMSRGVTGLFICILSRSCLVFSARRTLEKMRT